MSGGGTEGRRGRNVHAVFLCYGTDMVGSGDGACDGGLLLIVGKTLSCEKRGAALGDLNDYGGLDITREGRGEQNTERKRERWRTGQPREQSWRQKRK